MTTIDILAMALVLASLIGMGIAVAVWRHRDDAPHVQAFPHDEESEE